MSCHSPVQVSSMLRHSLKRGLAREALNQASASDANLPKIFQALRDLRPNQKARMRFVRRIGRHPGVITASAAAGLKHIVLVVRNVREVVSRKSGQDLFTEKALIYTRIVAFPGRRTTGYAIARLSFCAHAIERLVERSAYDLAPILSTLDAEANRGLGQIAGDLTISDSDDHYLTSRQGVWAGSLDQTDPEEEWDVVCTNPDVAIPIFSVRTFLNEDLMQPMVWLRWNEREGETRKES